jgi:drug/metabolite transporter (DMT)-like permease
VPAMYVFGQMLHPTMFGDIKIALKNADRKFWLRAVGSGVFLFLSQILIYSALGPLLPGIAITIFFVFPIVTVLMNWWITKEKPSWVRWLVIVMICLGVGSIHLPIESALHLPFWPVVAAVCSGASFAIHVVLIQQGTKEMHPVPLSFINFSTILILAFVCFFAIVIRAPFVPSNWIIQVNDGSWTHVAISGVMIGLLSFVSYLSNNIGIKMIGGSVAAIVAASGPVLTTLLQIFITGKRIGAIAWIGMSIVTLGVLLINTEKMISMFNATKIARRLASLFPAKLEAALPRWRR